MDMTDWARLLLAGSLETGLGGEEMEVRHSCREPTGSRVLPAPGGCEDRGSPARLTKQCLSLRFAKGLAPLHFI